MEVSTVSIWLKFRSMVARQVLDRQVLVSSQSAAVVAYVWQGSKHDHLCSQPGRLGVRAEFS